jgi:hypothetical protein
MGTDQYDKLMGLPCLTALMLGEQSEDEGALYGEHMLNASGGCVALPLPYPAPITT